MPPLPPASSREVLSRDTNPRREGHGFTERECSQGFRVEIFEENTTRSLTERSSKLGRGVVYRLPLAPFGRGEKEGSRGKPLGHCRGQSRLGEPLGAERPLARAKPLLIGGIAMKTP